jgi:hypothetical protein
LIRGDLGPAEAGDGEGVAFFVRERVREAEVSLDL